MAKTRKVLEAEAKALLLTDEEIKLAETNKELEKLIDESQPSEGGQIVLATQKMIDSNPEEFKDIEVGERIEIMEVEEGDEVGDESAAPEVEPTQEEGKGENKTGMPANSTIVHGGPVIKGARMPFGFSVVEGTDGQDGVKGSEKDFGAGKGVFLHSTQDTPNGKINTYKIVY